MPAPLLLLAGANAVTSLFSGISARKQAKRANELAARRAALANAVREANNVITASQNYLHSFGESQNNITQGKVYDRNSAAIARELIRDQQTTQGQSIMQQVRYATARGELLARASAAGIGGSSVDRMDGILAVQEAIQKEATDRIAASKVFEGHEAMLNSSMEHILGMSLGYSTGQLDIIPVTPDTIDVPSMANVTMNALVSGASTYLTAKAAK